MWFGLRVDLQEGSHGYVLAWLMRRTSWGPTRLKGGVLLALSKGFGSYVVIMAGSTDDF